MPTPPTNIPEEIHRALELAEEARRARSELKRHVHQHKISFTDLMEAGARGRTDEVGQGARVAGRITAYDALTAVYEIGYVRGTKILAETGVDPDSHLDELSQEKREALEEAVGD